ncbi:MAG TPA: histidine--tRNA ligase [Ruminococcaceae bacterium]|nr:histidine--tRNA ligase [Oscillospiraceae bacterium]
MSEINRAIKGTNDVLPKDSHKIQFLEKTMLETARLFGFREIRVPVFEHTEVFSRNVGDTTDVVQKEMYTFLDKGGRSITLRPELTAGVVRSSIEHGLIYDALPQKVCYIGGCYRYEKPQAGRLREFHQFGIECLGAASPSADAEVISVAHQILNKIGIEKISLQINSIGCPECRKDYQAALKDYFEKNIDKLCDTCKDRLTRNPMRILDCKSPVCSKLAENAPKVIDYLCDDCKKHFEGVKAHLDSAGLKYTVNPQIVRGLDYYTRTVFEFISGDIGAQSTVCGGGRYDALVEQMGGNPTPALGFGMGIERLLLLIENSNTPLPEDKTCDLYIAPMGEKASIKATEIANKIRFDGFEVQTDLCGRGLKAQMKYADKINAKFTLVLGDNELDTNTAEIKDMTTGTKTGTSLDKINDTLLSLVLNSALENVTDSIID